MKTSRPRELLLRRHRNAEPRLDALRAAVLQGTLPPSSELPSPTGWRVALRELLWPSRLAWIGLAMLGLGAFGLDRWVALSEPTRRSLPGLALRTRAAAEGVSQIRRLQDAELAQWMDEAFLAPAPVARPASPSPAETAPAVSPRRERSSLTSAVWVV